MTTPSPSPLADLVRDQRRKHAAGLRLAAASAAIVGAASVLLLGLSGWFLTGAAIAGVAGLAAAQAFNVLLPSAGIRLLAILRTAFRYLERLSGHAAALRALAAIRPALFAALAAAPPRQALALSRGEASARLVQDVDAVETRLIRLSAPWGGGAALAAGVAMATGASPWSALVVLVAAAASLLAARALAKRLTAQTGPAVQQATGELKDALAAYAAAAPELRVYGARARAAADVEALGRRLNDLKQRALAAQGAILIVQGAALGLAVALAVAFAHDAATPLAAMAGLATAMALEGLGGLAKAFEQDAGAQAAAARLDEVLVHRPGPAAALLPADPALRLGGEIFAPGERLAITGRSGSGKTTVLEGLLGLRESAGASPRAAFAWAPQEATLIAGTVRDNLALAGVHPDDALWEALSDAGLEARVRALPRGLDTWVGENGERLSGGERRRLSLARALLRGAPWLLLDEPTEGLDAATEALVVERLARRLDRTGQGLVLVSHRPAPRALVSRELPIETLASSRAIG